MPDASPQPHSVLDFGQNIHWSLGNVTWQTVHPEPLPSVADVAQAVHRALAEPLDFPSLDQAVVPGDQVVLAVDPAVPQRDAVVIAAVQWFCARGTDSKNMRVVLADDSHAAVETLEQALAAAGLVECQVEKHDPDDSQKIAYVAANEASEPIYMNRSVVDADVVIPISCARAAASLDYLGAYSLFPRLTDRSTRGRFYSRPRLGESSEHSKLQQSADQAAWWVGLLAGIQVIPAGRQAVACVLAGEMEAVEAACQMQMQQHWTSLGGGSDLVVATLDGDAGQQSWLNVARAIHAAVKCVRHGGSIVVCTQLDQPVGAGLKRLADTHLDPETIAEKLAKDAHDDALPAAVILDALRDHHVYLASELRKETVENLGLGVVESAEQLLHLIEQHPQRTLLNSAQYLGIQT